MRSEWERAKFQFTHPARGATAVRSDIPYIGRRFQFTHPARGATKRAEGRTPEESKFQFTHPARGATSDLGRFHSSDVSLHAPREGCDYPPLSLVPSFTWFQFTHPARGAT